MLILGVSSDTPGDVCRVVGAEYRAKASELAAQVTPDTKHEQRLEIEKLVLFYLRLADQADLNGKTDVTYVTPTKHPD